MAEQDEMDIPALSTDQCYYQLEFYPFGHIRSFVLLPGEEWRRSFEEYDAGSETKAIADIKRYYPDATRIFSAQMERELTRRREEYQKKHEDTCEMNDLYQYETQTGEGFDAIANLGHDLATIAYRKSVLAGTPPIYQDQASMDTAALVAASRYREAQQASVPNFTDDDQKFDAAYAAGYVVATQAEQDAILRDPDGYGAELQSLASRRTLAYIVDGWTRAPKIEK